mmetsp:Transcript_116441/g.362710  ORF Transcript_116441/g.362710 Transcript_116441/m.362710 type:complete len:203 (+) Transcript_116441:435-1043(+)
MRAVSLMHTNPSGRVGKPFGASHLGSGTLPPAESSSRRAPAVAGAARDRSPLPIASSRLVSKSSSPASVDGGFLPPASGAPLPAVSALRARSASPASTEPLPSPSMAANSSSRGSAASWPAAPASTPLCGEAMSSCLDSSPSPFPSKARSTSDARRPAAEAGPAAGAGGSPAEAEATASTEISRVAAWRRSLPGMTGARGDP